MSATDFDALANYIERIASAVEHRHGGLRPAFLLEEDDFTPRRAPETAPGPGVDLDAGQGLTSASSPSSTRGCLAPAAATAVPGPVTAHSFTSSPPRAAAPLSDDATETGGDAGGPGNTRRAPGPPAQRSPLQEPARGGRATLHAERGGR